MVGTGFGGWGWQRGVEVTSVTCEEAREDGGDADEPAIAEPGIQEAPSCQCSLSCFSSL